ncbi:MFS general substrate transporter [Teratosphaeria nubilosa]|uniref:MFS general substrate transporter n=1 Tax=Teratosphaeria nubilosa TaxID=161662 RepID=A0A6G1L677_9PEZI|nr:MFS general substrate transporter [Teratosphaeria nubilosa]
MRRNSRYCQRSPGPSTSAEHIAIGAPEHHVDTSQERLRAVAAVNNEEHTLTNPFRTPEPSTESLRLPLERPNDADGSSHPVEVQRTVASEPFRQDLDELRKNPEVSKALTAQYPTGIERYLNVTSVSLSVALTALDRTIVVNAIPTITTRFNSTSHIGWYGSSYLLTFCAFQLLFGKIYSFYNAKWVFISAVAIFSLGSPVSGAAQSSVMLIVGRAVNGLGAGGMATGAIIIITYTVPLRLRPIYTGILACVLSFSNAVAPLMGGALTQHADWRWCFWINLPVGAVSMITTSLILKLPPPRQGGTPWKNIAIAMDPVGNVCFVPSIMCLIMAGSMMSLIYYLPIWFQAVEDASATRSGIRMLAMVVPFAIVSLGSGVAISKWIGYYSPFMLACTATMAVGAGLLTTLPPSSGPGMWAGYQLIWGFGAGLGMQTGMLAAQTVSTRIDAPVAVSVVCFAQSLGSGVFLSIDQTIFL